MSAYTEYFLNSKSNVVYLDLIEISHPNFTQTYRKVRNNTKGVTVTLEDGAEATFDYYPMKVTPVSQQNDLDQAIKVTLGDLGDILPTEFEAVCEANAFDVKPTVKYYAYRSDDLTEPLIGPWVMEVTSFTYDREASEFEAKAPSLNINRTGELYKLERFPMLRGFL
jgi:hypothetical protein